MRILKLPSEDQARYDAQLASADSAALTIARILQRAAHAPFGPAFAPAPLYLDQAYSLLNDGELLDELLKVLAPIVNEPR